jgi:uncharacterized iron-regulated membrane protein
LPRLHAFLLGTTILAILIGALTYFLALSALRLYHRRHPAVAARAARRRKADHLPKSKVVIRKKPPERDSDHIVN